MKQSHLDFDDDPVEMRKRQMAAAKAFFQKKREERIVEEPEEPTASAAEPDPEGPRARLANLRWLSDSIFINKEAEVAVDIELPPETKDKGRVHFQLHSTTGKGEKRLTQVDGFAKGGAAKAKITVFHPGEREEGKLLQEVPMFLVAQHRMAEDIDTRASLKPAFLDADFIDVSLVSKKGEPLSGKGYRLELSDGSIREGKLDDEGRVFLEPVPPGKFQLFLTESTQGGESPTESGEEELPTDLSEDNPPNADKPEPRAICTRITGLLFETDKTFLLPQAIPGIRSFREVFDRNPGGETLVVGHADRTGQAEYNRKLSEERAKSVAAYLKDRAEDWNVYYTSAPVGETWGVREDQYMLSSLTDSDGPFYAGAIDGISGSGTQGGVKRFQKVAGLVEDGVAGPKTRLALIEAYMAQDKTSLPEEQKILVHGCGESHPLVATADGAEEEKNRRVEIFLFPEKVNPPPQVCPQPDGCGEYTKWTEAAKETVEVGPGGAEKGTIFLQLFDGTGVTPLSERSYVLNKSGGGTIAKGKTDGKGNLMASAVDPGDYEVNLEGVEEPFAALVLSPGSNEPQIRFLEVSA